MKRLNKSLIMILGVFGFVVMPGVVNASEFAFGTASVSSNVTTIPVNVELSESDGTINTVQFGCQTDNSMVSCEIKAASGVASTSDGSKTIFTSVEGFTTGSVKIADIILTNNDSAKVTGMNVSLKNGMIGTVSKTNSTTASVGAKAAAVVLSKNANLSGLTVSSGTMSPEFSGTVYEYTVYGIADTINSVKVTPTCAEGQCDYTVTGGSSVASNKTVTLKDGENVVSIAVTSEDGSQSNTYTITIYRGETSYNSSKLASLSFGTYTLSPSFNKEVTSYQLDVPNSVNNLVNLINYTLVDEKANVEVKGIENFVVGSNTLTLAVTNVNGDETVTYTINVNRLNDTDIIVNAYKDGKVTFTDSDGIKSTLSESEFQTKYPDEYKKIKNGDYLFDKDGNITTEEQLDSTEEETPKKKSKLWLVVVLIVVGVIIIGVSGFFIFRKKKPEDDMKKKNKNEKVQEENEVTSKEDTTVETLEDDLKNILNDEEKTSEEPIIGSDFSKNIDETVDIDDALNDLMSTKQYDFSDKDI